MDDLMITFRETTLDDMEQVKDVHVSAFGYEKEALLTIALLKDPTAESRLSLFAMRGEEPVGHILFTAAKFVGQDNSPQMHILAPLAVKKEYQNQGIGGKLIREGLARLKKSGSKMVFVLGHKEYYPRFGFKPHATRAGFDAPHSIPDDMGEYWMYQPLVPEAENMPGGKLECARTLNEPKHWRDDEADKK